MIVAPPIRVGIIEDHAMMRAGLKMLLSAHADIKVAGEAANRNESFAMVARERPDVLDVLIVDLQLEHESAADFLEELLAASEARAIIITGTSDQEQIHRALHAGATGLVYKEEDPEVLVRAIRKVHGGEVWLSRAMITSTLSRFRNGHTKTASSTDAAKIATLTPREREIVTLAASGLDRRKMAERLFLSEGTVRNHLSSIFGKLEVVSQLALVFYAKQHGLDRPAPRTSVPPNGAARQK